MRTLTETIVGQRQPQPRHSDRTRHRHMAVAPGDRTSGGAADPPSRNHPRVSVTGCVPRTDVGRPDCLQAAVDAEQRFVRGAMYRPSFWIPRDRGRWSE
jgi:hypothetical protein